MKVFTELSEEQVMKRGFIFFFIFLLVVLAGTSGIALASEGSVILSEAESSYRNHATSMSQLLNIIQTYNNGGDVRKDERDPSEELSAAHSCDSYVAGENLTVSGAVTYSGELSAVGVRVSLPSGWVPVRVTAWGTTLDFPEGGSISSGSATDKWWGATFVSPNALEIYWVTIPENPINFGYAVAIPDNESGPREISAEVLYRRLGGEEQANMTPDPLTVQPSSDESVCKDSDADGIIDQWDQCPGTPEGSWVNKNGCHAEGLYTEEQMNQMVQTILTWGDIDHDGKISLSEAVHALRISSGVTEPAVK